MEGDEMMMGMATAMACALARPCPARFCDLHRAFAKKVDVTMRQTHRAGEKFIDYLGASVRPGDCTWSRLTAGPRPGELTR
jgi:transposase